MLYLLHGYGDDQTGWVQFGEVMHFADGAINSGKATPMIIVMPDANTGTTGYVNDAKGDWRYEDFFFQEFIPFIEKTYRIRPDKHYRAIAGLSMGGGGSFVFAMHHPELFSSACPLSAATDIEIIDFLFEGNSLVHIAMRKKGIPHEFRIRDGVHNWVYWRSALPDVLEFVSMAFHQF